MTRIPFPPGAGIFETMRTEDGRIAELGRHMRRAISSAKELGIPFPEEDILRDEILARVSNESFAIGRLRICFSSKGLDFSYLPYVEETNPAVLTFHSITSTLVGAQHKTYPYDEHFEVLDEAILYGFDDAIIFNSRNEVTETAIANIAFYIEDRWVTPPLSAGLLPGTMRAIAIERCDVAVATVHISDIPKCGAALLLNSLKIARPVTHIGDYQLPDFAHANEKASAIREKLEFFSVS